MDAALGWLGELIHWLAEWIPRIKHIDLRQRGVKFVRGREPVLIAPGITLYWPITTRLEVWPVNVQTLPIESQTLCTSDDRIVECKIVITYRIDDLVSLFREIHDPATSNEELCLGATRRLVCNSTLEELGSDSDETDSQLYEIVCGIVNCVGVRVVRTTFASLAPVEARKHFGLQGIFPDNSGEE